MDVDVILADLKLATGWQKITWNGEYFVFVLNIQDMRVIKGLKQGYNCLYLNFESFTQLPISFVVRVNNTIHQYWVIGNNLHRTNDRPAYAAYNADQQRVCRRWHWNGLLHRENGPAKELIKGYTVVDLDGFDGYLQESWSFKNIEWFQEGFPCVFPCITSAELSSGTKITNKKTGLLHSPRPDLISFWTDGTTLVWDSAKDTKEFRPTSGRTHALAEVYDNGNMVRRECGDIDFNWAQGASEFRASDYTNFNNELINGELFSMLNLWGDLYQDDAIEVMLLTEFNRIGMDSK